MSVYKESNVDTVQKVVHKSKKVSYKSSSNSQNVKGNVMANSLGRNLRSCKFCGQKHVWSKNKCPAYGKCCPKCGKLNHFAIKCPVSSGGNRKQSSNCKINELETVVNNDSDDSCIEYVLKVDKSGTHDYDNKLVSAEMEINGYRVPFQVDSGASANVIPFKYVCNSELNPSDTMLEGWTSTTVKPLGKCRVVLKNCKNNKKYSVEFVVVKENFKPLLGKKASEQMGLIKINYENICNVTDVMSVYSDVFSNELGSLPGNVHLTVDKEVQPVAITSHNIAPCLRKKVKKILNDLSHDKVVCKVDQPTDWVSRMVTVIKDNGDIRVCIDPQVLNKALKREFHPMPVIDDILPELSKAKVFSKFDLKNGYWQCTLDEESSLLTTFQTPWGRYRWLRLPFGLSVSSEIFQKRLQMALDGIEGVTCVADDILVYGIGDNYEEALKDHDSKLHNLLRRCKSKGIKLN